MILYLLLFLALLGFAFAIGLLIAGGLARKSNDLSLYVIAVERRADAVFIKLARRSRLPLPAFQAGQYLWLKQWRQQKIARAYSLAAWQARPFYYELGIKAEPKGQYSALLVAGIKIGDRLICSPPQGHFVAGHTNGALVLIGGGIGITPMRAMAQAAWARGQQVYLFDCARDVDQLYYMAEFQAGPHQQHYFPRLSRPHQGWAGERGRLDAAQLLSRLSSLSPLAAQQFAFYICAGEAMQSALQQGLLQAGIAPSAIHTESFLPISTLPADCNLQAKIEIEQRGACNNQGLLLDSLTGAGYVIDAECRAGACQRCAVKVVQGELAWLRPRPADLPQNIALSCCCYPLTDIKLKLISN